MPIGGALIASADASAPHGPVRTPAVSRRAVASGVALFAVGFGVMNLFWWFGHWRTDVPGLWDYRSATIGDGVLLPVAAALLVATGDRLPDDRREIGPIVATAVLGGMVGGWVQWASLRDPHPQLNWTLPEVHTLNVPGWYHAALLVVVSGLFAGLTMRVLWRARSCRLASACLARPSLRHPATTVLTACLTGFVGLLVVDMYHTHTTASATSAIGAALGASAITAGVLVWGYGTRRTGQAWGYLGTGLAIAALLSWIAS